MKSVLRFAPFFLLVFLAPAAFAQNSRTVAYEISADDPYTFVAGAPVSYTVNLERMQVLADGTHITRKISGDLTFRDSEGRVRRDGGMFARFPTLRLVQIYDPVAGVHYILDTQHRVAYRFPLLSDTSSGVGNADSSNPRNLSVRKTATASPNPRRPQDSTESLGSQLIDGIYVQGKRTTKVFPIGSIGNDRPVTMIYETWRSPDLQIDVLAKSTDPVMGDNVTRLTKISRAEPDPLLFRVPAGYQIVDGPSDGRVSLKYELPQQ
jgi:hypothetical protein